MFGLESLLWKNVNLRSSAQPSHPAQVRGCSPPAALYISSTTSSTVSKNIMAANKFWSFHSSCDQISSCIQCQMRSSNMWSDNSLVIGSEVTMWNYRFWFYFYTSWSINQSNILWPSNNDRLYHSCLSQINPKHFKCDVPSTHTHTLQFIGIDINWYR